MRSLIKLQGKQTAIEDALSTLRYERTLSDYSNKNKRWFDKQESILLSHLSIIEADIETAIMRANFNKLSNTL